MAPTPLERVALLVIDVQTGLFCSEPPPFEAARVVRRIAALVRRARRAGAPVFFIQHESPSEALPPGSPAWRLHPGLKTGPADITLRKTTCDAFHRTPLAARLRKLGITTLVLAGYATDFCVDSTLRSAVSKGFQVVVASDAHTTHDNPVLKAEQVRRHHNWAWAECTAENPPRVLPAAEIRFLKS